MKKYFVVIILVIVAGAAGFFWTKNDIPSKILKRNDKVLSESEQPQETGQPEPAPNFPTTIGNFLITDREICQEEGKPIVYFFGSSGCPHCVWEKPIVQKALSQFKDEASYHENYDNSNDSDVFMTYANINPGYIPFLVLGCKYVRVGAGENLGATQEESEKLEEEALSAIICKLTNGKPDTVCAPLKDKIPQ